MVGAGGVVASGADLVEGVRCMECMRIGDAVKGGGALWNVCLGAAEGGATVGAGGYLEDPGFAEPRGARWKRVESEMRFAVGGGGCVRHALVRLEKGGHVVEACGVEEGVEGGCRGGESHAGGSCGGVRFSRS